MTAIQRTLYRTSLIGILLFSLTQAWAGDKPVYQTRSGVAIKGYDPVAYFTASQPVKGTEAHAFEWHGATWHFASAENKGKFAANPEKYAPQFGGYCAYAVAKGKTATIDPDAWKIVDNKLYLNYSTSIQKKWEADIPGHIAAAEKNWPKVLD